MRQIAIFHTDQGQPLGQGLSFIIQRENIDILWDIFLLADKAHLRNKAGGQPLEADGGSNLGIGAGDVGAGDDVGLLKALIDLPTHAVVKDAENRPGGPCQGAGGQYH